MEESHEILVKSLHRYGVLVPQRVSSVRELSSNDLFSICSQCLKLIDHTKLFPLSLPSGSVSDHVQICSEIASTVKNLGYVGDLSFHKFLYPSEEDTYKLIVFLMEKLSDLRESFKAADSIIPIEKRKLTQKNFEYSLDGSTKMTPYSKEKSLVMEVDIQASELQHLEHEFQLLKAATDMAFHDQQSLDFYLESFNAQLNAKKDSIIKLESDWEVKRKHIEGKKKSLEETLYGNNPLAQEMLKKLQDIELERQSVLVEIIRREEEHVRLYVDLQRQQIFTSRKSHIQRIQEITKNSRKQEADIDRIVKETRELQLEINSISERLDRTYAIADDMVFREAKKDFSGRQGYRLLNSIHEGFEQISDKILATDRIRKEMAELDIRLAAMASVSVNLDKLVADVDSIIRENEYLEHELQ